MSFVISVDGQPISTNGIIANITVGIPPTPGWINTDFASWTEMDATVRKLATVWSDILSNWDFQSYDGQNGSNPSQFKGVAVVNATGDVYSKYLGMGGWVNGAVTVFKKLSTGKYIIGGWFTGVAWVSVGRFAILNSDFSVDASLTNLLGTWFDKSTASYTWVVYDAVEQPDGKVIVVGNFNVFNGASYNRIIRFNTDWSVDTTFTTNLGSWPTGGAGTVLTVAIQTDGKIIFWGMFTSFSWNTTNFRRIIRRNSDGTADGTWTPWTAFSSGQVNRIILQSDGKIICCGTFTSFNATTRQRVCRLLTTGAIDTTFGTISGANSTVTSVDIDSSGNIYIVGNFTTYAGNACNRIARLTTLWAFDATYTIGTWFSASPTCICKSTTDDKMTVVCNLGTYNTSTTVNWIIRLTTVWGVDYTFGKWFDTAVTYISIANDATEWDYCMIGSSSIFTKYNNMRASNGNLLNGTAYINQYWLLKTSIPKGVWFTGLTSIESDNTNILLCATAYNWTTYNGLIKMNSGGVIDTTFNTNIWSGASTITNAVFDKDSKVMCVGTFTTFNGTTANRIVRLNSDGTVDSSFVSWTGFDATPNKIICQSDGKMILLGTQTAYNGTTVKRVIRINNDWSLDTSFALDESTYTPDEYTNVMYVEDNNRYYTTWYATFVWSYVACYDTNGTLLWKYELWFLGGPWSWWANALAYRNNKVYYGGNLEHYSPATGTGIGCIDATTGAWLDVWFGTWLWGTYVQVYDMVVIGSRLYVGGSFSSYNGTTSNNLVCINI